jgi:hypothetical protein
MLFKEAISVYCENSTKHTNTRCGQNALCYYAKAGGIYRVSRELCARLREGVPYVKVCRYNPKHHWLEKVKKHELFVAVCTGRMQFVVKTLCHLKTLDVQHSYSASSEESGKPYMNRNGNVWPA